MVKRMENEEALLPLTPQQLRERFAADRVLAIARGDHPAAIVAAVDVLVGAGISLTDLTDR